MYKTAGRFWARNRSLAKKAIAEVLADSRPQAQPLKASAPQPKSRAKRRKKHTITQPDVLDKDKQHINNEWRNRKEGHLLRWRGLLEKELAVIERLEREVHESEEMIEYAKGLGYSENDYRVLENKRKKLSASKESVFNLEDRISAVSNELELDEHSRNRLSTKKGAGKRKAEADIAHRNQISGDRNQQRALNLRSHNLLTPVGKSSARLKGGAVHKTNECLETRDQKKRKRTRVRDARRAPVPTDPELDESAKPWWEVGGGLYGLGKSRKH